MIRQILSTLKDLWRRPRGRRLVLGVIQVLALGTVFYRIVEDWSWVDSFYFTVVTLTTVGYGDLAPTTDFSRLFTTLFIITGVGFILAFLNFLVTRTADRFRGPDDEEDF